jgi:uncharacterized membrane protein
MDLQGAKPAKRLLLIAGLSFLSCSLFVLVRFGLTGRFAQGYLIWNLFLSSIPVAIAWKGSVMSARQRALTGSKTVGVLGFAAWLVFYPNAPYIFTDFIHVVRRAGLGIVAASWLSGNDLLWYDIVMNAAFAFVGHYLGLISMYIMHGTMRGLFGRVAGWMLMLPAILISGFGIHIGRFSRFNSWDLVLNPLDSARAVIKSIADPAAMLFSLAFSLFIAMTYFIFYIVKSGDLGSPGVVGTTKP